MPSVRPPTGCSGVVTTLVTPEQLPALQAMAEALDLALQEAPEPAPEPVDAGDLEAAKQGLEDLFNLL